MNETANASQVDKKERILEAAEKLFGDLGFEAVSTRVLAREAGVNMAMLSYYFGSKEKLFECMVTRRSEEGRANLLEIAGSSNSPKIKIDLLIDYFVEKLINSGRMQAIFSREISLQQRKGVSNLICVHYMNTIQTIMKVIKEGEKMGQFRKVDYELTIVSILSTISYLVNSPAMCRMIFNLADDVQIIKNEMIKRRVKKHLKDLVQTHLTLKTIAPG